MKTKFLIILCFIIFCFSCSDDDYNTFVEKDINKLKSPVVLIAKQKSFGSYSIVVKDANDSIRAYGNLSFLANTIGESRKLGDTIK